MDVPKTNSFSLASPLPFSMMPALHITGHFCFQISVLWIWLEGVLPNRGYCHVWDTRSLVSWEYCWDHHQGPVDTASSSMTSTETDSLQLLFTPKGEELTVPLGPQDFHFSKNTEISRRNSRFVCLLLFSFCFLPTQLTDRNGE